MKLKKNHREMKIGILTFHNAINYGAVLQCYALKEFLAQRGHEVQVIDYRNPYTEDYKKILPWVPLLEEKGIVGKLKFIIKSVFLYSKRRRICKVFKAFVDYRLNTTPSYHSASEIPTTFDCIVFGSDQIWNPRLCGGFDPVFYGQFYKGRTKFVVYAASLGNPSLIKDFEWNEIGRLIGVFDCISVRELNLKHAMENRFSISVTQCIDPTLLVNPDILSGIAKSPDIGDYVFMYNVQRDDAAEGFADYISKKINCKVVIGQSKPQMRNLRKNQNHLLVEMASPEEFLGLIKNAKIIIGNSFHSIAISIALKKDFYSIDCRKPERVKSLLNQLGLIDRHVKSTYRNIILKNVDYSIAERKLAVIRDSSINYLKEAGLLMN